MYAFARIVKANAHVMAAASCAHQRSKKPEILSGGHDISIIRVRRENKLYMALASESDKASVIKSIGVFSKYSSKKALKLERKLAGSTICLAISGNAAHLWPVESASSKISPA